MENIVYNFAKITFQSKSKEVVLSENRSATTFPSTAASATITTNTSSHNFAWGARATTGSTVCNNAMGDEMQETTDTNTSDEEQQDTGLDTQLSCSEDNDEESDYFSSGCSNGHRGGVSRRRMPTRASKDAFNRVCSVIMKPHKKKRKELNTNAQALKTIEKLYTSKRMKKFTPTSLETIFEEPSDENAADAEDDSEECAISSQVRLVKFGGRKLRRAISIGDGLNKNKNLVKKRRQKIKKQFGKRFALKKISMTEFHDRLNKSFDSAMLDGDEEGGGGGSSMQLFEGKAAVTMDDMQLPALAGAPMQSLTFD